MVKVPPIKSQGIKTKLVRWIGGIVPFDFCGRWIEPFMGTGVVGFNIAADNSLMCDTNPHVINFYQAIKEGVLTPECVRHYLEKEGSTLLDKGEKHYYVVRERFNQEYNPLDFLFLNRSGFNGMVRFNRNGCFNIPFCKKPQRFSKSYVTKIVNQVSYLYQLFKLKNFVFQCQSFEAAILKAEEDDIVYCDPPYIDRHVDYYNGWTAENEQKLFDLLSEKQCNFILSTWLHNKYRKNEYIDMLWNNFQVFSREHFYHVGASERNRNPMVEALVTNMETRPESEPERRDTRNACTCIVSPLSPIAEGSSGWKIGCRR